MLDWWGKISQGGIDIWKWQGRMICHSRGGRLIKAYEVTIQRYYKWQIYVNKMHILRCMGSKFCVNFKGVLWNFKQNFELIHCKIWILLSSIFAFELRYLWIVTSYGLVRRAPGQWQNAWSQTGFDDCCASSWIASVLSHSLSQLGQDFLPLHHLRSTIMQWSSN